MRVTVNGKYHFVHRIVALSFLPRPIEGSLTVDHIDGNKTNNCVDNLRWAGKAA